MNETKKLACGICGKEYHDIESRARCELACVKRHAEEAKKAAEAAKKEEQKRRKAEVDVIRAKYLELRNAYIEDYGFYTCPIELSEDMDYDAYVEEIMRQIFE